MPKAIIEFDDEDGEISMKMLFEGGFQVSSNAHQHANLCLKHLEEVCQAVATDGKMEYVEMADVDLAQAVPETMLVKPVQRAIQVIGH